MPSRLSIQRALPSPRSGGLPALAPAAAAQRVVELGVQGIATAADPAVAVAGVYGALRTSLRTRVSAALAAGVSDGDAAWRGELLAHFLLNPDATAGRWGCTGRAAIAVAGGPVDQGYVVLTLGHRGPAGSAVGLVRGGGRGRRGAPGAGISVAPAPAGVAGRVSRKTNAPMHSACVGAAA